MLFTNYYQIAGYAVGGGHVLHMVCDLTIAADNAIFGQTGPKVIFLVYLVSWYQDADNTNKVKHQILHHQFIVELRFLCSLSNPVSSFCRNHKHAVYFNIPICNSYHRLEALMLVMDLQ